MLKYTVSIAVLGMCLLLAGSAYADGYGPYRGDYQHQGAYYRGGHGYHGGYDYQVYAPPVYRPRVVYPVPYMVAPPVYQPVYPPDFGYYAVPGPSFYLQGRNFSLGIGF